MVRTAGGIRTRDNLVSQASARSAELQRYASRKIDKFETTGVISLSLWIKNLLIFS